MARDTLGNWNMIGVIKDANAHDMLWTDPSRNQYDVQMNNTEVWLTGRAINGLLTWNPTTKRYDTVLGYWSKVKQGEDATIQMP